MSESARALPRGAISAATPDGTDGAGDDTGDLTVAQLFLGLLTLFFVFSACGVVLFQRSRVEHERQRADVQAWTAFERQLDGSLDSPAAPGQYAAMESFLRDRVTSRDRDGDRDGAELAGLVSDLRRAAAALAQPTATTADLRRYTAAFGALDQASGELREQSVRRYERQTAKLDRRGTILGVGALLIVPIVLLIGRQMNRREQWLAAQREAALATVSRRERELHAVAARLERSNRDLQDFAYVASHDLQEPLRKIVTFGDRLRVKHGEALADEGRDYLDRMQSSAMRMQTLIQDLLAFSRVTSKAVPPRPVHLGDVMRAVAADLEDAVERNGATLDMDPESMPTIDADPTQLRQLLQNLVANAIKFRKPDVAPRVTVRTELVEGDFGQLPAELAANEQQWCQITIADNGIGFDEKYADRIFTVFQRLHGRSEYEGSGIGLSVCRRIAEHHRGVITVRSTPGVGSTFVVTLPVHRQDQPATKGSPDSSSSAVESATVSPAGRGLGAVTA